MPRKITISIKDLKIFAYHGVGEEEKHKGSWFEVECAFVYPADDAVEHDDLSATLNYAIAADMIRREMAVGSDLIEHAAGRIVKAMMAEFPLIERGSVKLSKINPAGCGEMTASVTIEW